MNSGKPNFLSQPVVKNIFMYRNGDPYYEPRRIVINQRRVSTFETLLREVTGGVQASFGAVRNIYTPRGGHKVDSLELLQSGEQYVAAGRERFKKLDYLQIGSRKKRMMLPMQAKPVPQSRIIVSARFLKPIKEPCAIFLVANGDVLNPAQRLLIQQRVLAQFDKILEIITEKMGLRVLGGVRSLFTFEGHQVTDGKQLESGQFYVAVGREKFKKLPYSDLLFTKPRGMRRVNGTKTSSLPPISRFTKQNGNSKSMLRCSDSGGDSKASPPAHRGGLSSIVREISQARLISLRKKRSRLSMSMAVSDNDDLESKIDDGNIEDKTPQDHPAEAKPTAEDTKGSEESGEKEGEKEEAAAENTTKDDTSTSKEAEKENQESNNELEGGATEELGLVNGGGKENEEEVKEEVKEEVMEEAKEEVKRDEQGGSSNTDEALDTTEKEDCKDAPACEDGKEEQDKNEGKDEKDEGAEERGDGVDTGRGEKEKEEENKEEEIKDETGEMQSDNKTKESHSSSSSSSNSNQEEDETKTKEGATGGSGGEERNKEEESKDETGEMQSDSKTKESHSSSSSSSNSNQEEDETKTKEGATGGSGGEEREVNGEIDGEDEAEGKGEEEENSASTKDAKANGEKGEDVDRDSDNKTDDTIRKEKDEERKEESYNENENNKKS